MPMSRCMLIRHNKMYEQIWLIIHRFHYWRQKDFSNGSLAQVNAILDAVRGSRRWVELTAEQHLQSVSRWMNHSVLPSEVMLGALLSSSHFPSKGLRSDIVSSVCQCTSVLFIDSLEFQPLHETSSLFIAPYGDFEHFNWFAEGFKKEI